MLIVAAIGAVTALLAYVIGRATVPGMIAVFVVIGVGQRVWAHWYRKRHGLPAESPRSAVAASTSTSLGSATCTGPPSAATPHRRLVRPLALVKDPPRTAPPMIPHAPAYSNEAD